MSQKCAKIPDVWKVFPRQNLRPGDPGPTLEKKNGTKSDLIKFTLTLTFFFNIEVIIIALLMHNQ